MIQIAKEKFALRKAMKICEQMCFLVYSFQAEISSIGAMRMVELMAKAAGRKSNWCCKAQSDIV